MLVISGVVFGAWLLLKPQDPSHVVMDDVWLSENIWKVESYKQLRDGRYDIYLLEIEPALERTFDDLQHTFNTTPYSSFNSYHLADGVNCQGMTCYLASWCERNAFNYSVAWTRSHTVTFIKYDGSWYKFDFDVQGSTIEPVAAKDVMKGMIVE